MKITANIPQQELTKALNNISKWKFAKRAKLKKEIHASAFDIDNGAKKLVRVDTSRLKNSIHVFNKTELGASIGTNVSYAEAQEFGTVRMKGQPYLRPSYEKERPKLLNRIRQIIAK